MQPNELSKLCYGKSFLFHGTVKGATASAIVYTLAETAKVNGLNIRLLPKRS